MPAAEAKRPWRRALLWLLLLGPFFFASYGLATHLAAQRVDVPSVVFDWERHLPFWPWTIVPYWSIDLLYGVSLFLCTRRHELDRHALRLLTAQVVAVTCFILWPLRFSFERPDTHGAFGWMFDVLAGFDKPFNQAPSLHIALLVILWVKFSDHLRGAWRWLLHGWFALIGLSVLTTWQHHFVDVPTGALLGWLCVWLWPDAPFAPPWRRGTEPMHPRRIRLALAYAVGGAVFSAAAFWMRGAAWWLLWVSVALWVVALAYAWSGTAAMQKDGEARMRAAVRWLAAPYQLAAWISSRLWTRRHPQPVHVAQGVWLGRLPTRHERQRFAAVVDVSAELPLPGPGPHDSAVPMLDLVPPGAMQLRQAAIAIETARAHGDVLVCCALGYSRSACAVAAWLLQHSHAPDWASALRQVQAAKPTVVLGVDHRAIVLGDAEVEMTHAR